MAANNLPYFTEGYILKTEIGNFKIKKLLGQGAQGEVYLIEDDNKKLYALKFIGDIDIFNTESSVYEKIKDKCYPYLICGKIVDDKYIIMDYIENSSTLTEYILNNKMDMKSILTIMLQLIDGLSRFDDIDITNTDIKLENIMIDDNLNIKYIDYGSCITRDNLDEGMYSSPIYASKEFRHIFMEENRDGLTHKSLFNIIRKYSVWCVGHVCLCLIKNNNKIYYMAKKTQKEIDDYIYTINTSFTGKDLEIFGKIKLFIESSMMRADYKQRLYPKELQKSFKMFFERNIYELSINSMLKICSDDKKVDILQTISEDVIKWLYPRCKALIQSGKPYKPLVKMIVREHDMRFR